MIKKSRALFVSHGGGPMPLLGDPGHAEMVDCLRAVANQIEKPSAIVVVSAHWEAPQATMTAAPNPDLIYDYHGFPAAAYQLAYPAPGDPALAERLYRSLQAAGISPKLDTQRGFDHGMYVPLKIMYPEADIPCVQLSLLNHLNPAAHIELGQALRSTINDNLLIIGSGFSFHNMQAFFQARSAGTDAKNAAFENWLATTCGDHALNEQQRRQRLVDWASAPFARYCHPREEHLLPLHVCYGFAGVPCTTTFKLHILNQRASMYLW
ncbi:DODA-type extradiol aromatic ring-opening family dioxygenase [Arenicella chitinivorans]|nr:class III extradiol ring-cleavage dioxygenase [Arenicella chitinivorans]